MPWTDRIAELERRLLVLERKVYKGLGRQRSRSVYWGDIVDRPFSVHYAVYNGENQIKCIGGNMEMNQDMSYGAATKTVPDELYPVSDFYGATGIGTVYIAVDMGSTSGPSDAGFTATTSALNNSGFGDQLRQYYSVARVSVENGAITSIANCVPNWSAWTPGSWGVTN